MSSNQELPTVSPLSEKVLRKRPERFERILGITVTDFDLLIQRLKAVRLGMMLKRRVLWESERIQRLHERTSDDIATDVCITLLYQRQYMTQEVLAACFDMEQGSISTIIKRTEALLPHALPTPEHLSDAVATTMEAMPAETLDSNGLSLVLDGTEQHTQRPQNDAQQRAQYSGKKSPYTQNTGCGNAYRLDSSSLTNDGRDNS
jgi:hypothetical protein